MFTGLIQAVGTVHRRGKGLLVEGCEALSPLSLGDSVAVDGVCLTVAELVPKGFFAVVSEETMSRTTLARKSECGELVNLEPALRLSDRLGGHLVSGHVDGLGEVIAAKALENSWHLELRWEDESFGRYMCEKASISLNGISLTVAGCSEEGRKFSMAIIPHTWEQTSLWKMKLGDAVNLEVDLMAKYVESLLKNMQAKKSNQKKQSSDLITEKWLSDQGWI